MTSDSCFPLPLLPSPRLLLLRPFLPLLSARTPVKKRGKEEDEREKEEEEA